MAARDRRRGVPDALRRAARRRRALRTGPVRRRPRPARPVQPSRRRAVGGARRTTLPPAPSPPCCPTTPTCRSTACPSPGGCPPPRHRWSRPPSIRTRPSAAAPGHGERQLSTSPAPATTRPRTASSTRPPRRAGACWSCPPGSRRVPTRKRSRRSRRSCGRLLTREGSTTDERAPSPPPLTAERDRRRHRPPRPGGGRALRPRRARTPRELHATDVTVDTANRLQGREFDVTVVLHPLSGRPDATAFHLETGRLCVLTSRHRHACVVVCRAGVAELLDDHPSTEPVQLGVTVKFPDGWEANHAVLSHLSAHTVPWRRVSPAVRPSSPPCADLHTRGRSGTMGGGPLQMEVGTCPSRDSAPDPRGGAPALPPSCTAALRALREQGRLRAVLRPGRDHRPARAAGALDRAGAGIPRRRRPCGGVPGDGRGAARRPQAVRPPLGRGGRRARATGRRTTHAR